MKITLLYPHESDVALCGITLKNAALSLSLVGHPCTGGSKHSRTVQLDKQA